jgi:hypothetical protein
MNIMLGMVGGGEVILILLILFIIPISLACFAFWIWMLVHAIQNKGLTDGEKIGWVLAIALIHFIGALLYCIIGRPKARQPLSPPTVVTTPLSHA